MQEKTKAKVVCEITDTANEITDKEAEKIASQYGITTEELFKEIDRDMLKYDLEMRKAIDVLKENNK